MLKCGCCCLRVPHFWQSISRSLLSVIEASGTAHNFTLDVFFNIADALEVDPADLISASMIPGKMLKGRKS